MRCMLIPNDAKKNINKKFVKAVNDNYFKKMIDDTEKFYLKSPRSRYSNLVYEHNMAMYNFLNSNLVTPDKSKFDVSKLLLLSLYHEMHKDHRIPKEVQKSIGPLYEQFIELKLNDMNSNVPTSYYSDLFEKNLPLLIFRTIDVSKIPLNGDKKLLIDWFNFHPKRFDEERYNLANIMYKFYYPISDLLGFETVFNEIKNTSVQTLYPENYKKIESNLRLNFEHLQGIKHSFEEEIRKLIEINSDDVIFCPFENGSLVKGRIKSAGSIVLKMNEKDLPITKMLELHDLVAFTVLVKDEVQARHFWEFIKDKYNHGDIFSEDYISNPRVNTGYQALHVDVYHKNVRVEIQIKTPEMYVRSERGDWCHAIYKNDEMKPGLLKVAEFVSAMKSSTPFKSNAPFLNLRGARLIAYYVNEGVQKEIYLDKYSTVFDMIMQSKISRDPFKVKIYSQNTGAEIFYNQLVNDGSTYIFKLINRRENLPKRTLYDLKSYCKNTESINFLKNEIKRK